MKTLADRIRYVRKQILRINQTQLADRLGVTRGAVGNWELGGKIELENLAALAALVGASIDWFRRGEGSPPAAERSASRENLDVVDRNGEAMSLPSKGIREIDSAAGLGGGQVPEQAYRAGADGWSVTDAFKPEPWIFPQRFVQSGLRARADQIIAITTQGDSMEPTIGHGDVVFVNTTHRRVSPPGLYAIRDVYGEIIVKRLDVFRTGDGLRIKIASDNPHERTREEPLDEVAIVGRVCGLFRTI